MNRFKPRPCFLKLFTACADGYCLFFVILLKINAAIKRIVAPLSTGESTYI